jgi:mono/diheme cytochrome c family protein
MRADHEPLARRSTRKQSAQRRPAVVAMGVALMAAGLGGLAAFFERWGGDVGAEKAVLVEGRTLYSQYCARCHGANLEGQRDWTGRLPSGRLPAPPHDASGHTWHHSDRVLFEITKKGPAAVVGSDYESDMPAFDGVLTDEQIRAVLAFIKSTWPERERRFQETVSQSDKKAARR